MRQVALVTGAARGIGASIAQALAQQGWRVVLADSDGAGDGTAAAIGSGARFVEVDVAAEADVNSLIDGINDGEGRLDALVCNAGIMIRAPLASLTLAQWERVIATNLTSTFLLVRAAETLLRAAGGAVVTIASTRAHMSEPDTECYSASKGGLVALTHSLAVSLGPQVRVNCISPGWIDTRADTLRHVDHAQHPAGRVGVPRDVASLAAWLVGDQSRFISGAEFIVDGGMMRKMIYAE